MLPRELARLLLVATSAVLAIEMPVAAEANRLA